MYAYSNRSLSLEQSHGKNSYRPALTVPNKASDSVLQLKNAFAPCSDLLFTSIVSQIAGKTNRAAVNIYFFFLDKGHNTEG